MLSKSPKDPTSLINFTANSATNTKPLTYALTTIAPQCNPDEDLPTLDSLNDLVEQTKFNSMGLLIPTPL